VVISAREKAAPELRDWEGRATNRISDLCCWWFLTVG
jgi:hypothetical protein